MIKKRLVVLHKEDASYIRKTLNGLIRESDRYQIQAVIDVSGELDGIDAGTLLDGEPRGIPIVTSLEQAVQETGMLPDHCLHTWCSRPENGQVPQDLERHLVDVLQAGVTLVNTSHFHLGGISELKEEARRSGAAIIDLRKPKPVNELAA